MKNKKTLLQAKQDLLNKMQADIIQVDNMLPYKKNAVLVPLVENGEGLGVLFEVRAKHLAWQPGEICFPGGRVEAEDLNYCCTAIRECCEELALGDQDIEVLGALDPITSPLGLEVYPYLGMIAELDKIVPSEDEVAEVFVVPLSFLYQNEPRIAKLEVATRPSPKTEFPYDLLPGHPTGWNIRNNYELRFYDYHGYIIWGITAHILFNFLEKYKDVLKEQ